MAAGFSPVAAMGRRRASLEEVKALYDRMLNLVTLDKKLDAEMMKMAPNPVRWEQLWQSNYNDVVEKLRTSDFSLFEEDVPEEEFTSEEDQDELIKDGGPLMKKPRSLRSAMKKQLSLLDKEKHVRNRRINFFERYSNIENRRNEMLNQKVALSMQIKDLLESEMHCEDVLDRQKEQIRRTMITAMARWWDCLLYDMSAELNQRLQEEEIGKWSKLYLKWRLWTDVKAGVFREEDYAR